MVRLRDSLSNFPPPLLRLLQALEERGEQENSQVSTTTHEAIVAQAGVEDAALVRMAIKENRKLSPAEVAELVEAYRAGASQKQLAKRFGLHEQTVRAHLRRQGVRLRPQRPLTDKQEAEVARLYVEEMRTIAELAERFGVGQTAVRSVLVRGGVERRGQRRRIR